MRPLRPQTPPPCLAALIAEISARWGVTLAKGIR